MNTGQYDGAVKLSGVSWKPSKEFKKPFQANLTIIKSGWMQAE